MNRFADLLAEVKPVNRFADLLNELPPVNEVPPVDLSQIQPMQFDLPQQTQIADPQSYTPSEIDTTGYRPGVYVPLMGIDIPPQVIEKPVQQPVSIRNPQAEALALSRAGFIDYNQIPLEDLPRSSKDRGTIAPTPVKIGKGAGPEFTQALKRSSSAIAEAFLRDIANRPYLAQEFTVLKDKFRPSDVQTTGEKIANFAGDTLPQLATSLVPGVGLVTVGSMEKQQGKELAQELGLSVPQQELVGSIVGGVNSLIETAQVGTILKAFGIDDAAKAALKTQAAKNVIKRLFDHKGQITRATLQSALEGGIEESLQEITTIATPQAVAGKNPLPELWNKRGQIGAAFAGGAIAEGAMGGAGRALNVAMQRPDVTISGAGLAPEQARQRFAPAQRPAPDQNAQQQSFSSLSQQGAVRAAPVSETSIVSEPKNDVEANAVIRDIYDRLSNGVNEGIDRFTLSAIGSNPNVSQQVRGLSKAIVNIMERAASGREQLPPDKLAAVTGLDEEYFARIQPNADTVPTQPQDSVSAQVNPAIETPQAAQTYGQVRDRKEAGFVRIPQAEDVKATIEAAVKVKEESVKVGKKIARRAGMKQRMKDFKKLPSDTVENTLGFMKYMTAPVDFELEKISPKLSQGVRWHVYEKLDGVAKAEDRSNKLLKAKYEMEVPDYNAAVEAFFSHDFEALGKIAEKYGFKDSLDDARKYLDEVYKRGLDAGLVMRYKGDYWPQHVKDMRGLLNYWYANKDNRDIIEDWIKNFKEKHKGRAPTDEELIKGVNSLIRGYTTQGVKLSSPGLTKTRQVDYVSPEIREFYADPFEALAYYIRTIEESIATNRFFGRINRDYLRLVQIESRYRQKYEEAVREGDVKKADNAWHAAELAHQDIIKAGYEDKFDTKRSVGGILSEMVNKGEIKPGQSTQAQKLLKSYFNSPQTSRGIQFYLSFNYMSKLGNSLYLHNIRQLPEIANSVMEDLKLSMPEAFKAFTGQSEINKNNAPYLRHLNEEFRNMTFDDVVSTVLGTTMYVDKPLKVSLVNTAVKKARKLARMQTPPDWFIDRLKTYFGDDWKDALADFRGNDLTDRVKFYGMSRLMDRQPVSKAQQTRFVLEHPDVGRPAMSFKIFSMRRIYGVVNDARRDFKAGRYERGIKQLIAVVALMVALDASANAIRDLVRGLKLKRADEYLLDVALQNTLYSRYDLALLEYDSLSDVAFSPFTPSIPLADEIWEAKKKGDTYPIMRTMPFIGEDVSRHMKPDSEKLRSVYPEKDDWKSDRYAVVYRALDNDDIQKAQKQYDELRKAGITNSDILSSVKSRSAVRVPEKDREQWIAGLSKKHREMYEREVERQKALEVKFYGLLSDSDLRKELAKSMTTPTESNGWTQRARKGQEEKVSAIVNELKRRKAQANTAGN